jgi:hypothetical protein
MDLDLLDSCSTLVLLCIHTKSSAVSLVPLITPNKSHSTERYCIKLIDGLLAMEADYNLFSSDLVGRINSYARLLGHGWETQWRPLVLSLPVVPSAVFAG